MSDDDRIKNLESELSKLSIILGMVYGMLMEFSERLSVDQKERFNKLSKIIEKALYEK